MPTQPVQITKVKQQFKFTCAQHFIRLYFCFDLKENETYKASSCYITAILLIGRINIHDNR